MIEMIVRNLIAFELFSSESEENCVTTFSHLLEELNQEAKYVEVLR